jgi:hypothetical protein
LRSQLCRSRSSVTAGLESCRVVAKPVCKLPWLGHEMGYDQEELTVSVVSWFLRGVVEWIPNLHAAKVSIHHQRVRLKCARQRQARKSGPLVAILGPDPEQPSVPL